MAKNVQQAAVNITVNAQQAKKMLAETSQKADELRKKIDQIAKSGGDPKQLKKLQQELKQTEHIMKQLKSESAQTTDVLKRLDRATPKELNKALAQLKRELNGIERGSAAWNAQIAKIKQVKAQIAELNAEMKVQQSWTQRLASKFNEFGASLMAAAAGLTGLVMAGKKAVSEFAQMDEAMANTRKFTGMTAEQVRDLNEEFKNMDTRTTRDKLNELAQEAGRLGKTSKEDIMGYVQAADILNVALSDLGEGATQKIAKLSNIFGVEDAEGTYNAMVKIGSVINVLSQNSTADKGYLVEFTNRLAGVGNQANMTIQQIVGLGAVLDANAQKVEASSTAIGQVLTRMYRDPAKYATVAGLEVEKFANLLKTDANEALLQFLEALKKAGGMDVLSPMFADMGENGSRVTTTLSALADKIDDVRWQQQNANKAFEEGTSVLHEYEIFNNTAQASIDKARKRIQELCIQLGEKLMPIMSHIMSSGTFTLKLLNNLVDFVKEYWKVLVTLTATILAYKIAVNASTIATKGLAAAQVAITAIEKSLHAMTLLLNAAYYAMTGRLTTARRAMILFNASIKANPIGLLVSALTAAAGAIWAFSDKTKKAREEMESFKKEIRDIDKTSAEYAAQEINRLDRLYKVATDEKKSRDARIHAAKELQAMSPQIFGNLETEAILTGKAAEKYYELRDSIISAAKARAAQEKIAENSRQLLELELRKKTLDKEIDDLKNQRTKAQAEFYNMQDMGSPSGYNAHYSGSGLQEIDKGIKERNTELSKNIEQTKKLTAANQELYDSHVKTNKVPSLSKPDDGGKGGYSPAGKGGYSNAMADKERKAALKKDQQAFKEGLKAIKAEEEKELNELYAKRATGQIDYLQYIDERKAIEAKFYDDSLKFYENNLKAIKGYNVEDDKDYQALQLKKTETLQKYENQRISYSAERIQRQSQFEIQELQNEYNWKENKTVVDEIALQEKILEIKVKYLQQQQDLYAKGTKEWEDLQLQIEKTVEDDRFNKEQIFLKAVNDMRKKYDQQSAKDKFEQQKQVLYWLYDQEKITLEEYRKLLKQMGVELEQELKKQKESLPGYGSSLKDINEKASADFDDDKRKLDKALEDGLIDEKEYDQFLQRAKNKMVSTFTEGLKKCGDEWVALFTSMGETWYNFFDGLGKGDDLQNLGKAMQATTAVMTAAISTITQFVQAEMQIQTAAIEKRYDAEISRAQGNSRLVARLEKQKEKEIAAEKNKANKKMFAMEVIQAIAQTATNALNAYGSAAAIPIVGHAMAPIAAGIATASGMVQVAAIKKQQQASEAQGYAEGGYTRPGRKYDVAGVVHAGEWVASQKLLNNPRTAPVISMLERAQRSNTIASFTYEDSDYFTGAPARIAAATSAQAPNVTINNDNVVLTQLADVILRLNARLDEPFTTVNTAFGDDGIQRALDNLNRYKRNKNRK